jgi:hypothetical protein
MDEKEVNYEDLPEDPYWIITLKWKEEGQAVFVDARGIDPAVAHAVLLKAAEVAFDRIKDPIIFFADEEMITEEELEEIEALGEDDDD